MSISPARTRGKFNRDIGMRYFYKKFLENHPTSTMTQTQFSDIWKEYMNAIMYEVIHNKYSFKIHGAMGNLFIISKKIQVRFTEDGELVKQGLRIDWQATHLLWDSDDKAKENRQLIYHFNEHSNRRNYRFFWDKRECKVRNQRLYIFVIARKWKRELAKFIKGDDFDVVYHEVEKSNFKRPNT